MPEQLQFQDNSYKVTARKWRPLSFSEVTSQEYITKTLKNSIKNNRVSHAYLFCGPRGVGKTTVARLLAKSINCLNPGKDGEPCNVCPSCTEINNDNRNHPDVFEIDGASNRNIEDVRELKEKVKYGPIRSKFKIFIIDEVHMLTGPSFNALLKTLEEPPPYVIFIFATTSPEKVPLTILGRCQKFEFKRLSINEIIERLGHIAKEEKVSIDEESLLYIAKKGDGSMRDAQGLFDIASAFSDNKITFAKLKIFFNLADADVYFKITDYIKEKNGQQLLMYVNTLMQQGYDMQTLLDGLTEHYRNLIVARSTNSASLIIESDEVKQKYISYIDKFSEIEILNSLKLILQAEYSFKYSSNQRTLFEALLIELVKFSGTKELSSILDDLNSLREDLKKNSNNITERLKSTVETPLPSAQNVTSVGGNGGKTNSQDKPSNGTEISESIKAAAENGKDVDHWDNIKKNLSSKNKWVHSLIKNSLFEYDSNRKCSLTLEDEYYDMINSYKDLLTSRLKEYFGKEIILEFKRLSETSPGKKEADVVKNIEKIKSILIDELKGKLVQPDA